jgi:hypothetical protein
VWHRHHYTTYLCDAYVENFASLSKYVENWKTFICDFANNVKLCQVDLHNIYYDEKKKYNYINFL